MIPRSDLRLVAEKAADRLISYPWKVWFWGDSIGLEGLLDASELTGDGKYLSFVHGLLKCWLARERFRSSFDYTAPGVALLRVYEQTGDTTLLEGARRHADYLSSFRKTTASAHIRYEDAAFELPPVLPPNHPDQGAASRAKPRNGGPCIFVDSVHFDGPFFAKLYQVTGEARCSELALANILPQIELLYDPDESLFHHFWIERTVARNGILWGRGNGWGLLGAVLTLEYLGVEQSSTRPLRELIQTSLARLAELQTDGGGWRTVLTDPTSYVESSTAAFFVDVICRAIRLGLVPYQKYGNVMERALRFLLDQVDEAGTLRGVSFETFPSTRLDHYRCLPRGAEAPWGQGPLLTAIGSYEQLRSASDVYPGQPEPRLKKDFIPCDSTTE